MTDRNLLEAPSKDGYRSHELPSNLQAESAIALSHGRLSSREQLSAYGGVSDNHHQTRSTDLLPVLTIESDLPKYCPANPLPHENIKIASKDNILPPLVIIDNEKRDSNLPTTAELNSQQILSSNKFDSLEALKQAWANLQKHHTSYESVSHTKEDQLKVGRYGLSAEQIENFLAALDTPSSAKTLDKFVKEHVLTNTMEKNLEDPKFRQEMKEFVQALDNGTPISKEQLKKFLPRQVQEAIASFHLEKMQENLGSSPGAVIGALEQGKSADSVESGFEHKPWSTKTKANELFHANIQRQETILEKAGEEKFKDLPNRIPENERRPLLEKALRLAGVSPTESNIAALQVMVQEESSWDPNATNNWDINATIFKTPSQGLIQTIPETFQRFAIAGYDSDITDPTSNLVAGIRYTLNRYGSLQRTPGIVAISHDAEYKGY